MSQQALELYAKLYAENGNSADFDFEFGEYEIIDEGDWEDEGKYQYCTMIVKFMGTYIAINKSRSGSYFTDWYYGDSYLSIVERKEEVKVVVSWERVSESIEVASRD